MVTYVNIQAHLYAEKSLRRCSAPLNSLWSLSVNETILDWGRSSFQLHSSPFSFNVQDRLSIRSHIKEENLANVLEQHSETPAECSVIELVKFAGRGQVIGDFPSRRNHIWPPCVRLSRICWQPNREDPRDGGEMGLLRTELVRRCECDGLGSYGSPYRGIPNIDQSDENVEFVTEYNLNTAELAPVSCTFEDGDSYVYFVEVVDQFGRLLASNCPGLSDPSTLNMRELGRLHLPILIHHRQSKQISQITYDHRVGFQFNFSPTVSDDRCKLNPLVLPEYLEQLIRNPRAMAYIQTEMVLLFEEGCPHITTDVICDTGSTEVDALLMLPAAIRSATASRIDKFRKPAAFVFPRCSMSKHRFLKGILPPVVDKEAHHKGVMDLSPALAHTLRSRYQRDKTWTSIEPRQEPQLIDYLEEGDILAAKSSIVHLCESPDDPKKLFNLYQGHCTDVVRNAGMTFIFGLWTECIGLVEGGLLHYTSELNNKRFLPKCAPCKDSLRSQSVVWPGSFERAGGVCTRSAPIYSVNAIGVLFKSDVDLIDPLRFWGPYESSVAFQQAVDFDCQSMLDIVTQPATILLAPLNEVVKLTEVECDLVPLVAHSGPLARMDAVLVWSSAIFRDPLTGRGVEFTNRPQRFDVHSELEIVRRSEQLLLRPLRANQPSFGINRWRPTTSSNKYECILKLSNGGCQLFGSPDCVAEENISSDPSSIKARAGLHEFQEKIIQRLIMSPEECQQAVDYLLYDDSMTELPEFRAEAARQLFLMRQ
eukprot:GHVH01011021.1.p1 GENE.GHVH01011021.1~~GHVH01011021.1.p1  ORF type:complete len:764 (+),score=108.10 GHVH01011021.1:882-3173(+)